MNDTATPSRDAIAYDIDFELFRESARNAELQGIGRLVIEPAGPFYVFTGKSRRLFAGGNIERRFGADQISNVVVQGRCVQFTHPATRGRGKERQVFTFFARNDADAQSIAGLMPATREVEFNERIEFNARLDALTGPKPAWRWATNIIIALNVAAFLFMAGVAGAGWFEVTDIRPYVQFGANNGAATTDGEWWRLLTSMFLHYGVIHLALNMWALLAAGHLLEKLLGTPLFVLTYLGAGIAGGFASIGWYGDAVWSAGASGAVFGVFGGMLGFMLRQKQAIPRAVFRGLVRSSSAFVLYNVLFGLSRSGIDNAAHLGGFAGGAVFAWLLAMPLDAEARRAITGRRLQLGLIALGVLVAVGINATPRFDYRLADEFALHDTNGKFAPQENEFLQRNHQALPALASPAQAAAHADWLKNDVIPFYQNWSREVAALELTPGRSTHAHRAQLLRIFQLRIDSLDRLATGLRRSRVDAIREFHLEDARIVAEIDRLNQPGG